MSDIQLSEISTKAPKNFDKASTKEEIKVLIERLKLLQNLMHAEHKHSLLIILQGIDASGKNGAIRKVFSGVNPMGCNVKSFKAPTDEQMDHDFLWRVHPHAPAKGMIQIFNRSHYEDVLVQRVHRWVDIDTIHRRFEHINNFEKLLQENGTTILKFYLHISKEEQTERLQERLLDRRKNWKYSPSDLEESKLWKSYMVAYENVLQVCSPEIPWIVVPSDQNWYKEYIIAQTIVQKLEGLNMKYPDLKVNR